MRLALVTAIVFATSGVALAQRQPELTWQGYVSGSAVLYIQGDRVDSQGRDTGAIDRPQVSFRSPLPAARQRVELDVRRGRGRVQVLEQPAPRNEYSAVVRVDPPGNRPELYVLDFYWDPYADEGGALSRNRRNRRARDDYGWQTRGRTADMYGGAGEMTWSGTVDHEALVEVRGNRAIVRTLRGRPVYGDATQFTSTMPRTSTSVRLEKLNGRGRVELVGEPGPDNNYAALVRVYDESDGADQYAFRLTWEGGTQYSSADPYRANDRGVLTPQGGYPYGDAGAGSMRWSGRVDGTVRVTVRGNQAWSSRVSGGPIYGERVSFGSVMPQRNLDDVEVRKVSGRGDVDIVQRPSASNGYALVFEIEDDDSGPDDYEIEVSWR